MAAEDGTAAGGGDQRPLVWLKRPSPQLQLAGGQRTGDEAEKARMTEEKLRPLLVPLPGQALRQYLEARTVPQAQAPVKPALQKQAMFGWGALRLDPVSKPAGQTWSMRHLVD
ncbi:MAG: hypothetical protein L6R39_004305 [Caloplaca ligustica]|nr:MAG: hypothetical protein L6R39_004305 [Caloplaca ligustica]